MGYFGDLLVEEYEWWDNMLILIYEVIFLDDLIFMKEKVNKYVCFDEVMEMVVLINIGILILSYFLFCFFFCGN